MQAKRELLQDHGLQCFAIGNHLTGQASATSSTSVTGRSCRRTCGATEIRKAFVSGRLEKCRTPRGPRHASA
jgi:hypothetical protein